MGILSEILESQYCKNLNIYWGYYYLYLMPSRNIFDKIRRNHFKYKTSSDVEILPYIRKYHTDHIFREMIEVPVDNNENYLLDLNLKKHLGFNNSKIDKENDMEKILLSKIIYLSSEAINKDNNFKNFKPYHNIIVKLLMFVPESNEKLLSEYNELDKNFKLFIHNRINCNNLLLQMKALHLSTESNLSDINTHILTKNKEESFINTQFLI